MKRTIEAVLVAFVVASLAHMPAVATEELAKTEDAKCTACHVKRHSELLNDKGKYYEYKRSFAGYDQLLRKFKKCTLCHKNEPGSQELTHTGMELESREVTMDHLIPPDPAKKRDEKKGKNDSKDD